MRRGVFRRHLAPIAFQLLGDQLRQRGHGALPHLGARDAHDHDIIGLDHDPGRDFGRGGARSTLHLSASLGHADSQGEAAGRGGAGDDEAATGKLRHMCHGAILPHALASEWIAARISA